jgi:hypothetical protein
MMFFFFTLLLETTDQSMGGEDSSQIRSSHMGWHLLAMFGFRVGTYFHHRPVMFGLLQIKAVTQEEPVPAC